MCEDFETQLKTEWFSVLMLGVCVCSCVCVYM